MVAVVLVIMYWPASAGITSDVDAHEHINNAKPMHSKSTPAPDK